MDLFLLLNHQLYFQVTYNKYKPNKKEICQMIENKL